MKRSIYAIIILLSSEGLFGQVQPNPEIEKEVNEQLWKPFKKALETRDGKLFTSLHTDDVLRVNTWSGIRIGAEYTERTVKAFAREDARTRVYDFWLAHRIYSRDTGYEVGYLRSISTEPGKETQTSYSRFHVVLKRIDGFWKIAQDWDVGIINGKPITAEDFDKKTPLDLTY